MGIKLAALLPGLLAQVLPQPKPVAWALIIGGALLCVVSGLAAWAALGGRFARALERPESRRALAGSVVAALAGGLLLLAGLLDEIGTPLRYFDAAATPDNPIVPEVIGFTRLLAYGTALWPALLCPAIGILLAAWRRTAGGPLLALGLFLGHGFAFWWPRPPVAAPRGEGDTTADADDEPEFELTLPSGKQMPMEAQERQYIENILELGATTARDVMRPRPDVVALDVEWPPARILETVAGSRHSRFPVYEGNIDSIVGVLHLRDLLEFLSRGDSIERLKLREILMDAMFVPESKKADDILRTLQRHKNHLTIVLDEYGGTAGILTIEDLLEEIVGEIQDEYDDEARLYHQREDGAWVVDAQLPLDEFNELLNTEYALEDVDTLGGLVLHNLGHIPAENEQLAIGPDGHPVTDESAEGGHLRLTVLSVDRNRVGQVLVERV